MAVSVRCFCCIIFTYFSISVALSSQFEDNHNVLPSNSLIDVVNLDGSHLENRDIHKRAANNPPVKKASASNEKKPVGKSAAASDIAIPIKSDEIVQNATEDTTANVTSIDFAFSTLGAKAADKYNVSSSTVSPDSAPSPTNSTSTVSSTSSSPSSTTKAATTTTTTTTTTTPSPISEFPEVPDVLPTRPSTIKNETEDHHIYYNSSFILKEDKAMSFWVNFDELPKDKIVVNTMLSHSHRRAATVSLSFDFPFYGHLLRNITIATGGFVYTGDYMHSWLAATQYIAPLMANFDTSLSSDSIVRYFDNGTAFVIEWNEVSLQDGKEGGNYTFQTTLLDNGNIVFVYKVIPASVLHIEDTSHPVKVGLSDAYVIDRIIYFIRRKTIYEYHKIDMKKVEIQNNSAIYFTALTTCLSYQDCNSCIGADIGLQCVWCESAKRCSDGLDRQRQDWLQLRCDTDEKKTDNCSARSDIKPDIQPLTDSPSKTYTINTPSSMPDNREQPTPPHTPGKPSQTNDDGASSSARVGEENSTMGVGSVVAILLILAVVMGSMVWVGYAYRNPHTFSGQLLIRYRPSQWRFRSGEARYTAASVHM